MSASTISTAPLPRLFSFTAGDAGPWAVDAMHCLVGEALAAAPRLLVWADHAPSTDAAPAWTLRGITSNDRYVERPEKAALAHKQVAMGRTEATRAALIPIRKNAAWWALTQEERRAVFEAQSHHIAIGMKYLPAIARKLHHCRDLGTPEPFDFLTWFDYAPKDEAAFNDLLAALRASPEWAYVDREIDIRVHRVAL
jgi:Chlorite dismutase